LDGKRNGQRHTAHQRTDIPALAGRSQTRVWTAGTATGVAINSVSGQAVSIPVVVRDDMGVQIATDTISLAANGHLAFTLSTDKYPATANIRGTVEFDKPAVAQIGVLGIRVPVTHTFTTLPPLAK